MYYSPVRTSDDPYRDNEHGDSNAVGSNAPSTSVAAVVIRGAHADHDLDGVVAVAVGYGNRNSALYYQIPDGSAPVVATTRRVRSDAWADVAVIRGRQADSTGIECRPAARPLGSNTVRLVIARCSADYVGRLTAHLPMATRLLMVKADGSVLIHSDGGSYKPLNWMSPPCALDEQPGTWTVTNKAGEQLIITIDELISELSYDLGVDPGLVKDGVEAHLQVLLAAHIETFGDGYQLVRREYPTPVGPVNIMARDPSYVVDVAYAREPGGTSQSRSSGERRSMPSNN